MHLNEAFAVYPSVNAMLVCVNSTNNITKHGNAYHLLNALQLVILLSVRNL